MKPLDPKDAAVITYFVRRGRITEAQEKRAIRIASPAMRSELRRLARELRSKRAHSTQSPTTRGLRTWAAKAGKD